MLIDSHCHLDFPHFSEDLDEVVARARNANVSKMLTISTRVKCFREVCAIVEKYSEVYCSVGTHCCYVDEEPAIEVEDLVELSLHLKCVAIGETGLDYYQGRDSSKRSQIASFRRHIAASRLTGLPLIVHARNADDDIISILSEEIKYAVFPHVLHCYSSGSKLARVGIELGAYISFSGIITFKKSDELRNLAKTIPISRILVETDAPYLLPLQRKSKRNEPAFVGDIVEVLAKLHCVSSEEMAEQVTDNFYRLFRKVEK